MSEQQLLQFLREEFRNLTEHVRSLSTGVAHLEGKVVQAAALNEEIHTLRKRMEAMAAQQVTNGVVIGTLVGPEAKVANLEKKVEGLMLSRAALIGYATAAGSTAAAIMKYIIP